MSQRDAYMRKVADCLRAVEKLRDPAERAALVKIAACYTMLADYVATRQDYGTVHRTEDRPHMRPD